MSLSHTVICFTDFLFGLCVLLAHFIFCLLVFFLPSSLMNEGF